MFIFNSLSIQLAVISICLVASNKAFHQSGCANFFQLAPLPFCDGTSQFPGVTSGGLLPPIIPGILPPVTSGGLPPVTSGGLPPVTSGGLPPVTSGGHPPVTSGGHPPVTSGGHPPVTSGGLTNKRSEGGTVGILQAALRYRRNIVEMPKQVGSSPNSFATKVGNNLIFKSNEPSKAVAGGNGLCGNYDTNTVMGVCLWSGIDSTGQDPKKSGWISGSAPTNCNREVEIWRSQSPDKKFTAKVVDGCNFEDKQFKVGCENVFVTKKLLAALDPTAEEEISDLKWSFKKIQTIF